MAIARVVAWLLVFGTAAPALAAQPDLPPPPDLAALTLTPLDEGLAGFLHIGGFVESLAGEAAAVAAYRGQGTSPATVAARLAETGWRRKYVATLGLPAEADPGRYQTVVRSYVAEYADPAGAAAGFAYLEDERLIASARDVPTTRTFGDASELTRERGLSTDGQPFRAADLTFRVGDLVAGVTVIAHPGLTFDDPDLAFIEALTASLEARVASPPAPGTTLGSRVLRLRDEDGPFVTLDDAYYRRVSRDIPLADESAQTTAYRVSAYGDAIDVYQLFQTVTVDGSPDALASTTLYRFPSADAAAAWLDALIDVLGENPYYADPRLRPLTSSLGDQSIAIDFVPRGGSPNAPRGSLVAVRTGADVGRVQLVPYPGARSAPLAVVETLAELQSKCLASTTCPGSVLLPEGVVVSALDRRSSAAGDT